jgi:glc operon protein GlcG
MLRSLVISAATCAAVLFGAQASAQAPAAYGETLNIETARKAAAAASDEAKKNGWAMCIAITAPSGDLVYFERMDNCQFASITISQHKAKAAATFRRATKSFEERVASGPAGIAVLTLDGVIASEGGIPIVVGGKIVGAMGCSGGSGQQDGQTCQAGVNAVK